MHTANKHGNVMVHLARRYLPGSTIYALQKETARGMGPNKCRCKMPCPPPIPTTNPRKEIWIASSEVARGMEPSPPEQESPHRDRIPAQLEYLRQLYCTSETGKISKQVQTAYTRGIQKVKAKYV